MVVVVCCSFALSWDTPLLFFFFFLLLCQTQIVFSSQRYSFLTKSLYSSEILYLSLYITTNIYIYIYKQKDSGFNFTWTRKSVVYDKGIFFSFSFFCFWFGGEGGKRGWGVLYLNHTHSLTFYFSFSYSVHSLLN